MEDYENSPVFWTGESFIPKGVLKEEESRDYGNLGGSAAEFTGGQDAVPIPAADERYISRPTLAELAYQGKQRSNQEALKNQLNPLAWHELNQFDVHILCTYMRGTSEPGNHGLIGLSLRDCLSLMFWLSAPLERVLKLPRFGRPPGPGSSEGLYLKDDRILIARLHSPGPQLESQGVNRISKLAYQVEYHCNIPLPQIAHTESLLAACCNPSANYDHSLGFAAIADELVDSAYGLIREELGRLNREFGTRLSAGRISRYWLNALSREPGEDPPSAMLFFGQRERFSVARLHYTCAPAQRMEQAYRRICTELLAELGQPTGFPDDGKFNGPIFLGTPFCPRPEAVKALVRSLREAVEQTRPIRKKLSSVKNFHNHFAMYTACLVAFATTYRAVRNPSFHENDIDFRTGMGVISDKDDDTYYHSRFVWLSETCRQQIINYRRHLQRLYELFGLYSPALFRLFKDLDLHGRPLNLFLIPRSDDFLEELRPALIGKILAENHGYDLPVNAHRHYLKSELLRSGCPLEIIEAQMGHWEQGQEPWNRFSNLKPQDMCWQLDLHLSPILRRDGWIALKGYEQ
ncbi:MAG TPA: hypothetical protein VMJ66_07575 [Geobacteraceae bacterium]|nr:hypothetical protein [Geobacteraceae bacterium]